MIICWGLGWPLSFAFLSRRRNHFQNLEEKETGTDQAKVSGKFQLRAAATALNEIVGNLATGLACPCWGTYNVLISFGLTTANTQCQPSRWVAKRSPSLLQASGSGQKGPRPSLCDWGWNPSEPDGGDSPGGMGSMYGSSAPGWA